MKTLEDIIVVHDVIRNGRPERIMTSVLRMECINTDFNIINSIMTEVSRSTKDGKAPDFTVVFGYGYAGEGVRTPVLLPMVSPRDDVIPLPLSREMSNILSTDCAEGNKFSDKSIWIRHSKQDVRPSSLTKRFIQEMLSRNPEKLNDVVLQLLSGRFDNEQPY